MPITVNDVVQVTIKTVLEGKNAMNVTHWRVGRPIEPGDSRDIAIKVLGAYQDELLPFLSSSLDVVGADYVDLDSIEGDSGSIGPVSGKDDSGSASAASLPPNTALLVRKHTEGGRATRGGRMYLMGIPEGEVNNNGTLVSASVTGWNTAVDAFLSEVNEPPGEDSEIAMCVVRRPPGNTGEGESFDVVNLSASELMATQRERMRR